MAEIFVLIGRRVREERKARKLSQQELADAIGTDTGHISRIENGKTQPSIAKIKAIADALGVSLAALFADVPVKKPADDGWSVKMATILRDVSPKKRTKVLRVLKSIAED